MRYVISLGGSVLGFPPNKEWARAFGNIVRKYDVAAIVVGGGPIARTYMDSDAPKWKRDVIGMEASRLNALWFSSITGFPYKDFTLEEFKETVVIGGGTGVPGVTTDYAAALLCEINNAVFVNITKAGGIYTSDPSKENASLISRLTYDELIEMALNTDKREPGTHFPLDLPSILILRRSKIKTFVIGPDLKNLEAFFRGEEWKGTLIG